MFLKNRCAFLLAMSKTHAPELLLPAGDLEKLDFAFAYGADAAYAGVPIYSLRARENGFTTESLVEGIRRAKTLGRRMYLTMNIYAHNSKVSRFLDTFAELADLGPDGFIMTDVGRYEINLNAAYSAAEAREVCKGTKLC